MSHSYLDKSDETFQSGELLRSQLKYNSSIHCYYYSCIQITNYLFKVKENKSDSEIRNLFRTENSHNETLNALVGLVGRMNRREIIQYFNDLKQKRVQADYREFKLNETQSIESKEMSFKFLTLVKSIL
ncbi:TPA: hypothetical protein L3261_001754 [Elizabethkingia anophelis]|nr:hypothetical protein [Elizabethkingia anophelis]HBN6702169.1 hypothetical protein [Elizabethkingia anophelis]HBN6706294.1 hypothetical protein [Elizabethkingia anophelis]HBN6710326.1 hypothetical protein [Elizabethkingia anophelis]HBN6713123.1 hypothetical protein [Elizabethkingia anophelis]